MARFYQFTAADLYYKVIPNSADSGSPAPIIPNTDAIFPEILLMLAKNLVKYRIYTLQFQATLLEIDTEELRHAVRALTGRYYAEFVDDFLVLRVRAAIGDFPKWGTVEDKAYSLGFSPSGLYRFMKRRMNRTPSGRTWYKYG